jgi:hypothetical protein
MPEKKGMKTYFKTLVFLLLPFIAAAQLPTVTGSTQVRVSEGNNAWIATLNQLLAGRVGPDSTWVKYSGSYLNKRTLDNVYRYGTTSLRSTDTSGILNIYNQANPKASIYDRYGDATSNAHLFFQLDPDAQSSNSTVGNFNFWGTNFTGVNSPYSSRANHVWRFGYNTGGGGSRIISTDADLHIAFESNYYRTVAGGAVKRIWEWHLQSEDTTGTVHRPLSLGGAHNGSVGDFGISTDLISFANYAGTAKGWMSFKFGQYTKGLTWLDTAIINFSLPQPGVDLIRARNAGNTADYSLLQLDGSNRVVFPRSSIDMYSYAGKLTFNTVATITTADANPIQIGDATNKSFVSIYAPSTEVLRLRSNTGGSNLWQTYVNSDNIVWARPDGAAYLQAYATSAPQVILANDRMGIGTSPANTLDVNGTARIRTMTGTATSIAGFNGSNEISSITVGSGLSLSGNTLTATAGGVGGSGSANQVAYWTASTTLAGSANYLFDGTSKLSMLASSAATTTDPSVNYQITGGSSWITGIDNSDNDRFKISLRNALGTNDRMWMDTTGKAFFQHTGVFNNQNANVATIGSVSGSENYPGIWFGSATPSLSNYAFLADVAASKTILNAPSGGYVSVGVNNSEVIRVKSPGISIATGAAPLNALDVEGGAVIGASYAGTNTAPTNGLQVQGVTMVGTSSSAGQFNVDGSGSTSATFSGVFRNSSAQTVLAVRDDQRVGVNTSAPARTLDVNGEVRIVDLTTDTPTKIVGSDADGDLNAVSPSAEFSLTGSALNLAQQGATSGQVLEWNGSAWAPATDDTGGGSGGHTIRDDGTDMTSRAALNFVSSSTVTATATDDAANNETEVTFAVPTDGITTTQIAADAVGTSEIATDGVGSAEIAANAVGTAEIAASAVTYAKIQDVTASRLLGNATGSAAAPAEIPLGTGLGFSAGNLTNTGDTNAADDAPVGASYLTTALSLMLTDERVATAGVNVTGTDGGAGSTFTFDALSGSASPSQITSDQDNYNPTSWSTATTIRVSGNATIRAITGFSALADGTLRRLVNVGTYALYVPSNHPDSDAANRVAGSKDYIIPPNGGILEMYYDATTDLWRVIEQGFDASNMIESGVSGHFYQASVGSTTGADWGHIGFGIASGANGQTAPTSTLPAGWSINTSTSASGAASLFYPKSAANSVESGSAHIVTSFAVYFSTLSDGIQTYTFSGGIVPTATSTTLNVNNSVTVQYTNGTNSGKWLLVSRDNAGTQSTADLGVTVAANTVYIITVTLDKARSEARAYVTPVGSATSSARVTGNMPSATDSGARVIQVKSAGTTSREAVISNFIHYTVY